MDRRDFIAGTGALALTVGKAGAQQPAASPPTPPGTLTNEQVKAEKAKAMQWHSERPLTGSVPAHEHDFDVTPNDRMFVRNNLLTPALDMNTHRLAIKGLVDKELSWSVQELAKAFPTLQIKGMLE